MGGLTSQTLMRRSTRVRARIPILITSRDPTITLSLLGETLIVNAHGCTATIPQPLEIGMPVGLRVRESGQATARIVFCQPMAGSQSSWMAGVELDIPGNIWGLTPSPEDWAGGDRGAAESKTREPGLGRATIELKMPVWPLASPSAQAARAAGASEEELKQQLAAQQEAIARLEDQLAAAMASVPQMVRQQLSDAQPQMLAQVREQLAAALAGLVRPLQEELAVCGKKAEDAQQIRAAVAEQFEQLPWHIEQHTQAAFRPLQEQARAELEGIIAEARSQDEQETAQRQALQASAQALQKELAQARASLESSMGSLPERIQGPIAAAVEDGLARAHAAMSTALARELEALHERGRMVAEELRAAADALRSEREATRAQIREAGAKREELRLWLAEEQASYTKQVGRQLEQLAHDLASRSAGVLEEQIRSDIEVRAERAEADLNQRLGPMLNHAADLRQEALSLLGALQRQSQRCETQVRALLAEKDGVEAWITERAADFQKMFHDALVETTGQIKGRLQMAVEMIEQPVAKLRDQAAQQLQEQASRQARHLREHADEACDRVTRLQRDIENSVREALRAQAAETSATCGREIAQLAQRSVEEWRSALARNLESITNLLGQKLPGGEE